MRSVWFNCAAGVAGDMLLASLVDAGAERLAVMDAWGALGVGGYAATWERVERCGVSSLWTNLVVDVPHHGRDDGAEHHRDGQVHRPAGEVIAMIADAPLTDRVRRDATAVYRALAEVEGEVHGIDPEQVELHEVGALDSILDVVGVCAALADLGIDRIVHSPIAVGHGTVRTRHGTLPNPVPAVARLLARRAATAVGLDTTMETATPTGVALVTVLGECAPMPPMRVTATGFGAGTADPADRPNVVHATVGEQAPSIPRASGSESLVQIETNVDDVGGEVLAHVIARAIEVGARDAWATPIVMKKGRPAHTVHALCDDALLGEVQRVIVEETGSLGSRAWQVRRWPEVRHELVVEVDGRRVRIKVADHRLKVEHDDALVVARASGRPLRDVIAEAERLAADARSGR
jgi:uncharacterized protein (TIGR00299 family) protein